MGYNRCVEEMESGRRQGGLGKKRNSELVRMNDQWLGQVST